MGHPLLPQQRERLERYSSRHSVDIHCHCLPGLDDGPATPAEALSLCRALVADGVTVAVATPHQLGRYDRRNRAAAVRAAVASLQASLDEAGVPLTVLPGADVRLDERITEMLDAGEVLTLGGIGRHLLLELPHESFIDPLPLIRQLAARGVQTIVSHPERHTMLSKQLWRVRIWREAGAALQITAGSLLGEFGSTAQRVGWELLEGGLAAFVASDAHGSRTRPPRLSAAAAAIERRLGHAVARLVCVKNPLRVVQPAIDVRRQPSREPVLTA